MAIQTALFISELADPPARDIDLFDFFKPPGKVAIGENVLYVCCNYNISI
jgi:hypothetical protein